MVRFRVGGRDQTLRMCTRARLGIRVHSFSTDPNLESNVTICFKSDSKP